MTEPTTSIEKHGLGICLVICASLTLALMNAGVKWLTQLGYPALQVTFFNGGFGIAAVLGWLVATRRVYTLKKIDRLLFLYVPVLVCGCFGLFYAFGHGALGEMSTIVSSSPLMVAVLSFFFLREKLSPLQVALALAGFVGIILILRPDRGLTGDLPQMAALVGMFLLASSQVLVRKLSAQMHTLAIIFYFYVGLVVISSFVVDWAPIAMKDLPVFLVCGLLDVVGLVLMYTAFRYAPASMVAPFQYSNVLWSVLLGYLIWAEVPQPVMGIGMAVVVVSGIFFTRAALNRKAGAA